jgi:8-oxo-dGTP pyrophosphatase MutT (NUDIX family)
MARVVRQVAVIPFSRGRNGVRLCLIRRRDSENWGIPKGFIDPGDSPEEAALNEASEEAGLDGQLVGDVLGTYEYAKGSTPLTVAVYLMDVLQEDGAWDEMSFRERRWFSLDEAAVLLKKHPVRPLLDRVRSRLEGGT